MKMIINFPCRLPFIAATWLLLTLGMPQRGEAQATYFTPRGLLTEFFPRSQQVTYKRLELSFEQRARVEQKLGYTLPKTAYTIYIAKSGDTVDGYAMLDE